MTIEAIPSVVQKELRAHEVVLWSGRPDPVRYAASNSGTTFLFGVPWTLAILFGVLNGAEIGSIIQYVFGYGFLFIGIALLLSPAYSYWEALRTIYAATNQRALIFGGVFRPRITSLIPRDIDALELRMSSNGRGTVVLTRIHTYESTGEGMGWVTRTRSFVAIDGAHQAFTELERLKEEAVARAPA